MGDSDYCLDIRVWVSDWLDNEGETMSEWRPQGWANPFPEKPSGWFGSDNEEAIAYAAKREGFEACANAMLAELRARGVHRINQPFDAPPNTGTWVFIPDDEKPRGMPTSDARKRIEESYQCETSMTTSTPVCETLSSGENTQSQ